MECRRKNREIREKIIDVFFIAKTKEEHLE
jgi:hypothetical protein